MKTIYYITLSLTAYYKTMDSLINELEFTISHLKNGLFDSGEIIQELFEYLQLYIGDDIVIVKCNDINEKYELLKHVKKNSYGLSNFENKILF